MFLNLGTSDVLGWMILRRDGDVLCIVGCWASTLFLSAWQPKKPELPCVLAWQRWRYSKRHRQRETFSGKEIYNALEHFMKETVSGHWWVGIGPDWYCLAMHNSDLLPKSWPHLETLKMILRVRHYIVVPLPSVVSLYRPTFSSFTISWLF